MTSTEKELCQMKWKTVMQNANKVYLISFFSMINHAPIQGVSKKLNKPEIALQLCKAPQCTKFFIEIGCLGTDNVV